jgi:signal transduction histidine kinase
VVSLNNATNNLSDDKRLARLDVDGQYRPSRVAVNLDRAHRRSLQNQTALFARLQQVSTTGCFCWNRVEHTLTWTEEVSRILMLDNDAQASLEQLVSRVHPNDFSLFQRMLDEARRGIEFNYECRLRGPDESVRYVRISTAVERTAGGEYIGTIQDVTQQRLTDASLERMRSELAHLAGVAGVGALTASIAHEISQPLTGILANTSACLRVLAAETPDLNAAREMLLLALRDGERASEIITGLRALFKKKAAAIQPTNLNAAVRDVITLVGTELRRRGIELNLDCGENLPNVLGDKVQLQQVVLNLLFNAVEAMASNQQHEKQLSIATECDEGQRVRLSVSDSGEGFDPQELERMFDAFYTTKRHGMGIGLTVSRSIVESHGGRLWAEPNPSGGAKFYVVLPVVNAWQDGGEAAAVRATASL